MLHRRYYPCLWLIISTLLFSCSGKGTTATRVAFINSFKGRIFALKATTRVKGKKQYLRTSEGEIVRKSGASLISSLIKKLEKDSSPMIKVANANFLYGSSEAYFTDGREAVNFLSKLGFKGLVLGHRDFYFGPDILEKLATPQDTSVRLKADTGNAPHEFLCANLQDKKTGKRPPFIKPYRIYTSKTGHSVAIIGLITRSAISKIPPAQFSRFRYIDPATTLPPLITALRKKNISRIIVMGDFNLKQEKNGNCTTEPDLNAVLNLAVDLFLVRSKTPIKKIVRIQCKTKQGKTKVARLAAIKEGAECMGVYTFGKSAEDDSFQIHAIDSRFIDPDLSIAESLYTLHEALAVIAGKQVGVARKEMTHSTSRESALGNLVCDALREYCKTDMILINSGAIKNRLAEGPITRKDLYSVLPYQNLMVGLRLTGAQLLKLLENSVSHLGENMKSFPQVSGLRFRYNPARPAGNRIVPGSVFIGANGLAPGGLYTIAVPEFIASGGDRYTTLQKGIQSGNYTVYMPFFDQNDRNIVETYIERHSRNRGGVLHRIEGRIVNIARK